MARWRIYPYDLHFRHPHYHYTGARDKARALCLRYSLTHKGALLQVCHKYKGWSPLSRPDDPPYIHYSYPAMLTKLRQEYMANITL